MQVNVKNSRPFLKSSKIVISRCIAETHYQLGVALGFNAQFDEAVNALSDAIAVLEKRIGFLKEGKASIGKII